MAYQALYRKWRPCTFSEVIGQDAVMTALRNQIKSGHIGHAYLFCGTRGTGKTSTAKIFARAVNCLHPVDGNPCNECEMCLQGENDYNVIEIDAASNNGVDNIRDLREEVQYVPSNGKYRVYIVDEVHMLSTSAFNALLKTLEEPPSHVIFILATTEPHKILPTILSRCQRYDFRRIGGRVLTQHLQTICQVEHIDIELDALRYIADAADGGCRDALSILDQCSSYYMNEHITVGMVLDILGAADRHIFYTMTKTLLSRDRRACLEETESLLASGRDTTRFLLDWIAYMRNILLIQMMGPAAYDVIAVPDSELQEIREIASQAGPDTISYYTEELAALELSLRSSTEKRILFEVGLLRLCRLEDRDTRALLTRIEMLERKIANGIPVQAVKTEQPAVPVQQTPAAEQAASSEPAAVPKPKSITEPAVPEQIAVPEQTAVPESTAAPAAQAAPAASVPTASNTGYPQLSDADWQRIYQDMLNQQFHALEGTELRQNDEGIFLVVSDDFKLSLLNRGNPSIVQRIAHSIQSVIGQVPVRAVNKTFFGNAEGPMDGQLDLDDILRSIGGPVNIT
ncbi:MAG: DNA polymerase III subunit gamma/tau [Firmicutes bacterium]|nr:DNA polymerase III subunit gamma/tau [Bacillota bacterium]